MLQNSGGGASTPHTQIDATLGHHQVISAGGPELAKPEVAAAHSTHAGRSEGANAIYTYSLFRTRQDDEAFFWLCLQVAVKCKG